MLTTSALTRSIGSRILFQDVSFEIRPSKRIALVGSNGTGKTTLLETLVGFQEPDSGNVYRSQNLKIGYLPQEIQIINDSQIMDEVLKGAENIQNISNRIDELAKQLAQTKDTNHKRLLTEYGEAQTQFEYSGGYSVEAEAHRILAGLGFAPEDYKRPLDELSGGWQMRVALARLLVSKPDLLILDEPTNHLDVDSVGWLESNLANWQTGLLFVSHDRDFIDAIANRVLELNNSQLTEYTGGFADFVIARNRWLTEQKTAAKNQTRKVAQTEKFIERFRYKASKARQVQSRIKTLEKLEVISVEERKSNTASFSFPVPERSSRVVAELENVDVGYDGQIVLRDLTFSIERGMNIALVGPNGAGKTTLVRLITGEIKPAKGQLRRGGNIKLASFDQLQEKILDPDRTVLSELRTVPGVEPPGRNLRTYLASFGFRGDAAEQQIKELSGGEQTRLALAKTLAVPVNLLVLDEPTNHLDLPSCDILEDALLAYPGTVIIISHDQHLVRSVADNLIEVRNGKAIWHNGVPEYVLYPNKKTDSKNLQKKKLTKPTDKKVKNLNSEKELYKLLKKAEKDWEMAEAALVGFNKDLENPELFRNPETAKKLVNEYECAKDQAANFMAVWEDLDSKIRSIKNSDHKNQKH